VEKAAASTHRSTPRQAMPLRAVFACAALCFLFGGNAVAIKFSLTGLGVFTNIGLRFTIAAIALLCYALLRGKKISVSPGQLPPLALLSALFFFQIAGFYNGLNMTTAAHGILISNALPFVVMIMAHFLLPGERIVPQKIVGLTLGFGGVAFLFGDAASMSRAALIGDLIILGSVLLWGASAILLKRLSATIDPLQLTLYPMLISGPIHLVNGFFLDPTMVRSLDLPVLGSMFYQSLVTAAFGFVAWNTLIKNYGATSVHAFVFLMPISGVCLGVLLLGEELTVNLLGAIVMVTAGLIIQNRSGKRPVQNVATRQPDLPPPPAN
jgi:drug/metabolite transporter (DMT)-like permease